MKKFYHISLKALCVFCLTLCYATFTYAATLTSKVNRNQINSNETLSLIVSYDGQADSSQLDLAELNSDFEVLSVSPQSNNSISIINGRTTRVVSTTWSINIAPKREGKLTIPAFTINGDSSKSIIITVDDSAANNPSGQPLQVWVSADSDTIYPSQQLLVEVEISAQSDVSNLNGPQLIINGAEVEALGQQNVERIENGIAKQIIILKYAVFAKEPGELIIPVMRFTGLKGGRASVFDRFSSRGKQIIARSEQLAITVKAPPTRENTQWFPAKNIVISSTWSSDTSAMKVGEPITRTVKVTALSQRAGAIPPLDNPANSNSFKSYKDQAQLDNQTSANGITGTRTQSEAIVPSQAGELVLPERKLSWWNVSEGRWQEAVLPAETLMVSGSASADANPPVLTTPLPQAATPIVSSENKNSSNQVWQIIAAILALICLLQLWAIIKLRKAQPIDTAPDEANLSEPKSWQQLQGALKTQDPKSIRKTLIDWAQTISLGEQYTSLYELANALEDSELATQLSKLDAHIYSDNHDLDIAELEKSIIRARHNIIESKKLNKENSNALKPLYT